MAKKSRFEEILEEYRQRYDVDSLSSPNDKSNLATFINIQIAVEKLQSEVQRLINEDIVSNIDNIQKINVALEKMLEKGLQLERALALDRKTRAADKADTFADYLAKIKIMAAEYLDKQFIKVYCPECKILVGRVIPALEHTSFECHFQCSQCSHRVTVKRQERDLFFDFKINDRRWRKAHTYEVVQPKISEAPVLESDADLIIEDEEIDGAT